MTESTCGYDRDMNDPASCRERGEGKSLDTRSGCSSRRWGKTDEVGRVNSDRTRGNHEGPRPFLMVRQGQEPYCTAL